MKNKDLIKQLKNFKKSSVNKSSLDSIEKNLKEYMAFYSPESEKELTATPEINRVRMFNSPLLKFASIVIIIGLILGGGKAVYASLPGETLYPIKLITEDLQEMVIFNQNKKAEFEIHLAEKRIKEIESLEKKELVNNEET